MISLNISLTLSAASKSDSVTSTSIPTPSKSATKALSKKAQSLILTYSKCSKSNKKSNESIDAQLFNVNLFKFGHTLGNSLKSDK